MNLQSWKFDWTLPASDAGAPRLVGLSARALNVIKELSLELTGECPPQGAWSPPNELLQKLTATHLALARNCGARTMGEIIAWAAARGVIIEPPRRSKALEAVWRDLAAEAAARKLTKAEITAALDRSIRRKSARIPVAFQIVLLKILSSTYE